MTRILFLKTLYKFRTILSDDLPYTYTCKKNVYLHVEKLNALAVSPYVNDFDLVFRQKQGLECSVKTGFLKNLTLVPGSFF